MGDIVKVADKQQGFFLLLGAADENHHALLVIAAVNPLEALRVIILLIKSRMAQIQVIQRLYVILHLLMNRVLCQIPLQGCIFIPLIHLGKILSHKQQLFPGMSGHKTISCSQVLSLLLQRLPRHLPDHRALAVNYLIVGEHQHKILAVSIQHGECQLSVIILAEIGVAAHIAGKIVHPAHIPLKIESKAAVLRLSGHHRPGRGLLRDQDSSILSSLKHGA